MIVPLNGRFARASEQDPAICSLHPRVGVGVSSPGSRLRKITEFRDLASAGRPFICRALSVPGSGGRATPSRSDLIQQKTLLLHEIVDNVFDRFSGGVP